MSHKQVKIIASDVDGTLLKSGETELDARTVIALERAKASGITLVIASGRRYEDLERLFMKVKKDVFFVCLDGALVVRNDEILFKSVIDEKAIETVRKRCSKEEQDRIEYYGYGQENEVCKIALYRPANQDVGKNTGKLKRIYFCEEWVEYVNQNVDKGRALREIQKLLGVNERQCAAFGDNLNDMEMLRQVTHSYALKQGRDEIRKMCKYETANVVDTIEAELL